MKNEEAISAIKNLVHSLDNYYCGLNERGKTAFRMAITALEERRWIPVTERLPKDEIYVLVTTVSGDVTEAKYWQKEGFGY